MPRPPRARQLMAEDHLAENVRLARASRGWSAAHLADEMTRAGCAIDQSAIHKIEKQGRRITVNELVGFRKVLKMTMEQLISDPALTASREAEETVNALLKLEDRHRRNAAAHGAEMERLVQQLLLLRGVSLEARAAVDFYLTSTSAEGELSVVLAELKTSPLKASYRTGPGSRRVQDSPTGGAPDGQHRTET